MAYSVDSFPGREIISNGTSKLYFGGTSYLGLQADTEFQELLINGIKKFGTNYGASRESNVQLSIFKEVEQYLASLVGSQDCITQSSGFLAGQLVAQTMNTNNYELFYAPDTHAAVHIPSKERYSSFEGLNAAVREHLEKFQSTPVVFLDTLDTEGENYPDFKGLQQLPLDQIIIVADDSHGIGIVGNYGSGSYQVLKALQAKELIVCCSLGKGFGVQAGAIFGTKQRISSFVNTGLYGGASPATPAALSVLITAQDIFENKRALLQQHIQLFLSQVENTSQFTFVPKHSAFGFSNTKLATFLASNNIIITNFNYPTKNDALMSRIILSAHHTKTDIEQISKVLNRF